MIVRFQEIGQKHGDFPSIETLEGFLIFPDLLAKLSSDSRQSGKNTSFSRPSKRLTCSATEKSTSPLCQWGGDWRATAARIKPLDSRGRSKAGSLTTPMELDDELCLCFHVTRRKVENFIKQKQPTRASQLSECFGAGTGCGWCRPFLRRLWQRAQPTMETQIVEPIVPTGGSGSDESPPTDTQPHADLMLPSPAEYAQQRAEYREKQRRERGTP